jgi:hypothetical protein
MNRIVPSTASKLSFLACAFAISASLHAGPTATTAGLRTAFADPAPDTRPGCYWYWINDNISKEGITKDLEAMARVGIGRAFIGHIFTYAPPRDSPVGDVKFGSDDWWDAVQWAVREAGRVGVEIGFFNSPGWSQSGGPWVKPDQSMRYIDAGTTHIAGGRRVEQKLALPPIHTYPTKGGNKPVRVGPDFTADDFQDVAVFAFPRPAGTDLPMAAIPATSATLRPLGHLFDGSTDTSLQLTPDPQTIEFTLDGATPVQSLAIHPLDDSFTMDCVVVGEDNGETIRLAEYNEQRGHQGPRRKDPILIPFQETKTGKLRVTLSTSKPVRVSGLTLSGRAVLGHYVRKQLAETAPSIQPPWATYTWPGQAVPAGSIIDPASVIDLTGHMDKDGILRWDAPPGEWVVRRAGMIPIGTYCSPSSEESGGLEADKMSKEHIRSHFDAMVGEFLRRTPAADRTALKYVIADSYETGPQNWTDAFLEKFQQRFGYSALPYLPCIDGDVVGSVDITNRFLWDWRKLIAESIAYDYVGGLRKMAHDHDLTLWLENYGHWGFPSEFLLYGSMSDQISGEFWETSDPRKNIEMRAASSAARIYGRTDAYAEAHTSHRTFKQSPAALKRHTDWAFATGINHFILHVYIHQPDERKPGIAQWFGTAFNRHNTWFEPGKAYLDYLRRSSVLLKTGRPVVDVAYHIGEINPAMTGPETNKLPAGYDFDHINTDALTHRARVVNGRITMENGPSYAVLVLAPQPIMTQETAATIQRLVRDGATIVGPRPAASPSLAGFPGCDDKLRAIADEVWGDLDGIKTKRRSFGKGTVYQGVALGEVLSDLGLAPDFLVEDNPQLRWATAGTSGNQAVGIGEAGGILFTHRAAADHDAYFLSNTGDETATFTASLRTSGRQPELWDAATGMTHPATAYTQQDGRTRIPLSLAPSESVFIVFTSPIAPDASGTAGTNHPARETLASLNGPWTVRFNGQGAPAETTFDTLTDWSQHPDPAIRHYAGTAIYQSSFDLTEIPQDRNITLALGEAGVIAKVIVNGSEAGTAWCEPWETAIGSHLKSGTNTLEIHVTNTWNNRLVADAGLPAADRQSYISEGNLFRPKDPLLKSGLTGPVVILAEPSTQE